MYHKVNLFPYNMIKLWNLAKCSYKTVVRLLHFKSNPSKSIKEVCY